MLLELIENAKNAEKRKSRDGRPRRALVRAPLIDGPLTLLLPLATIGLWPLLPKAETWGNTRSGVRQH